MKKIYYVHLFTIAIYCIGISVSIGVLLITKFCINCLFPASINALIVLLCPTVSAGLRIYVWRRKKVLLSESEMNHLGTKVFFMLIPVEICMVLVGTMIIFI